MKGFSLTPEKNQNCMGKQVHEAECGVGLIYDSTKQTARQTDRDQARIKQRVRAPDFDKNTTEPATYSEREVRLGHEGFGRSDIKQRRVTAHLQPVNLHYVHP